MSQEHSREWIPNINIGQDYDDRFLDAAIHYDRLHNLADFFGRDMPVHRHAQHLQIHYVKEGDINFHIDDKLYQVTGPSLFLTPPAIPHSFCTEEGAEGQVLTIQQRLLWQLFQASSGGEQDLTFNRGVCLVPRHLTESQQRHWRLIEEILRNIDAEWFSTDAPHKPLVMENLVSLLLIQINRLSTQQAHSTEVNNDDLRIYNRFTSEIERHFQDHWLLPAYTQAVGVSETRLNQICQRISNSSPKKLIRERLLQEIKRLLTFSGLSVNEIAFQMGFQDPAYFSRFFKNQLGVSPLNYRKQHRQEQHIK